MASRLGGFPEPESLNTFVGFHFVVPITMASKTADKGRSKWQAYQDAGTDRESTMGKTEAILSSSVKMWPSSRSNCSNRASAMLSKIP